MIRLSLCLALLTVPAVAHETTLRLTEPVANAQAPSDVSEAGYFAILPSDKIDGLNEGRLVIFFARTRATPEPGVFADGELLLLCEEHLPFVASLPPAGETVDPAERRFGIGAVRDRGDGKSDRALLATWRVGDGCVFD